MCGRFASVASRADLLERFAVDQLRAVMGPLVDGSLDMCAVSRAVNDVKNDGPELLAPLRATEV